jgi:hypothetical protein
MVFETTAHAGVKRSTGLEARTITALECPVCEDVRIQGQAVAPFTTLSERQGGAPERNYTYEGKSVSCPEFVRNYQEWEGASTA